MSQNSKFSTLSCFFFSFKNSYRYLLKVCGRKKDRWEYYVNEFEQHNVVLQLAKYIPTKDPQLEPESYQSILVAALYNHPVLFYRLIKVWNPDIYRVGEYLNRFLPTAFKIFKIIYKVAVFFSF